MPTYIDRVQKSVTLYEPGPLPENVEDLGIYLVTELKRLGSILYNQATFRLERIHEEPQRPRTGDIRYADGSDWNPGQGENLYYFDGTNWIAFAGGSGAGDWGQLVKTASQTAPAANTAYTITWDNVTYSSGISIDSSDSSKILFTHPGYYFVDFSCLLQSSSASTQNFWAWPRINGVNVTNGTGIHESVHANSQEATLTKMGIFRIESGDYLQATWAVDNTNLYLYNLPATSFAPSVPSATMSIIQVAQ